MQFDKLIQWKTFIVTLIIFILKAECGLYFPMGDVKTTIPGDKLRLSEPLMTLRALDDSPRSYQNHFAGTLVNYSHTGSSLLQIEPVTGVVTFSKEFYELPEINAVTIIAANITAAYSNDNEEQETSSLLHQTSVRIALDPRQSRPLDCDLYTKDLCFWKSVKYKLYENRLSTVIGSLSSPYLAEMCRTHRLRYKLLNGTEHLSIERSTTDRKQWQVRSLKAFDRDINRSNINKRPFGVGATVYFGVKCIVSSADGDTERDIVETLQINILDENDNTPKPQFTESELEVHISNDTDLKTQLENISHLIFIDRDSKAVNNYTVKILNDYLHIFKVNLQIFADDRDGHHETAIKFLLWSVKNAKIPFPIYTVILQINDTTLLPGNGDSTTNVTIHFINNAPKPIKIPAPENLRKNLLYPEKESIFRTASLLARVSQPPDTTITDSRFKLIHDSSADDKSSGAFNVTVKGGIIYVKNIAALKKSSSPVTLEVQWENKETKEKSEDIILIYLEHESSPSCQNHGNSIKDWQHCAKSLSVKSCTELCGLGTGGRAAVFNYNNNGNTRCVWRGDKKPGNKTSTFYSTCTLDVQTCPDGVCDPLEELHHLICPQDCTNQADIWLGHKNKNTGLGISKGKGACHCDEHSKCYCGHHVKKTATTIITTTIKTESSSTTNIPIGPFTSPLIKAEPNTSAHKVDIMTHIGSCGSNNKCVIGIVAGSLFLLAAITSVVACWRIRSVGKGNRRGRKYTESVNSLNGVNNPDCIDRTIPSTDTLLLNFDMNTSLTINPTLPAKIIPVVDPKWEFPREKLRIEQTLGEGEFGRVLRARALEIANMPGYTTVAVKTLKEDAREGELADLMSEYQLLKEVSHPNVIKLLGASTLPGGPVYLIIEFAEHGSLRNYLRRSRHLESEAIPGEIEPSVQPTCKISPRDILSFAWQISKGMSYLNDMKLVHRDLAARNILLATAMVCKISDFGLTRDVYEDDTYLKRTKGRVPVKWMAPESLADHIYNTKSDVWSFGILLWELVTLGASPYPGIAVQNLFHFLRSGYRMERPENCSPHLYNIMRACWTDEPLERPSFRTLTLKLETMLADGVDYLDLNPRVVHNRTYFTSIPDSLITPDEVDETTGSGNQIQMNKDTVLWKRPESPTPTTTRNYENEVKQQEPQHYESPIKFRNKAEGLKTPTNDRPLSYLMMNGIPTETQSLLRTKSKDDMEQVSKITSL